MLFGFGVQQNAHGDHTCAKAAEECDGIAKQENRKPNEKGSLNSIGNTVEDKAYYKMSLFNNYWKTKRNYFIYGTYTI